MDHHAPTLRAALRHSPQMPAPCRPKRFASTCAKWSSIERNISWRTRRSVSTIRPSAIAPAVRAATMHSSYSLTHSLALAGTEAIFLFGKYFAIRLAARLNIGKLRLRLDLTPRATARHWHSSVQTSFAAAHPRVEHQAGPNKKAPTKPAPSLVIPKNRLVQRRNRSRCSHFRTQVGCWLKHNDDRSDFHPIIEVHHVLIGHADAT